MASGNNISTDEELRGNSNLSIRSSWSASSVTAETDLHIYEGGVALQQFFIFVFLAASIKFHRTFARETPAEKKAQADLLLYTVYAVLGLITVGPSSLRIVFFLEVYDVANENPSSEFCFALPNILKVLQARSQTTRHTSTVSTRCPCLLLWRYSTLFIQEKSWPVKTVISLPGRRGRPWSSLEI